MNANVIQAHHFMQRRAVKTALLARCHDLHASPEITERAWRSCVASLACGSSAAWAITQALRFVKAATCAGQDGGSAA